MTSRLPMQHARHGFGAGRLDDLDRGFDRAEIGLFLRPAAIVAGQVFRPYAEHNATAADGCGKPVAQLLAHPGLALPTSPKIIQNVVEKIAEVRPPSRLNARSCRDNFGTSAR